MTVASTFVPQQADPSSADPRRQEPSMEDILASIRRIIADDQTQGVRSGYDEPGPGASPAPEAGPEPDSAVSSVPAEERSRASSRIAYEQVFDLATVPGVSIPETAPVSYDEPSPAPQGTEPTVEPETDGDREASPAASYASVEERGMALTEAPAEVRDGPLPRPRFRPSRSDENLSQTNHTAQQPAVFEVDPHENVLPDAAEATEETGDALISPVLGASVMSAFETLAATVMLQNTEMLDRIMRELLRPMVKVWLDENLPTLVERLVRGEIERVARGGRG